ncbi:MAG: hypothetical protein AAFY50_04805 [Cyanobacteria bacterium J06648_1]
MSHWQPIGCGLEAKIAGNQEIWVRNSGQAKEFPHLTLDVDERGQIINLRSSDSRAAIGSIEGLSIIVSLVKDSGLK